MTCHTTIYARDNEDFGRGMIYRKAAIWHGDAMDRFVSIRGESAIARLMCPPKRTTQNFTKRGEQDAERSKRAHERRMRLIGHIHLWMGTKAIAESSGETQGYVTRAMLELERAGLAKKRRMAAHSNAMEWRRMENA